MNWHLKVAAMLGRWTHRPCGSYRAALRRIAQLERLQRLMAARAV